MRQLKLRLPRQTKNTLLSQIELYSENDSLSNLIFRAVYNPPVLSEEFSHIKLNVVCDEWPFYIFVDQMRCIRDYGYYVDWHAVEGDIEQRGLSEFIGGEKIFRQDICQVRRGALYWNEWAPSPVYFWRGYDDFAEDVDFLERFANQL